LFFLETINIQAVQAIELLDQDKRTEVYLSERQRAFWEALQENQLLSRTKIHNLTKVPSGTVRQALVKLIGMEQVEAVGEGRATKYRVK